VSGHEADLMASHSIDEQTKDIIVHAEITRSAKFAKAACRRSKPFILFDKISPAREG
jgi:hypothetical protein